MIRSILPISLVALTLLVSCDSIEPAGPAQYSNPDYPSAEKGYFFCGEDPSGCCFSRGSHTVWVTVPSNEMIIYKDVSQAVVNPMISDTLHVHFTPELIIPSPDSQYLYVAENGSGSVYRIDSETLEHELVHICSSSIYAMGTSNDGDLLYLGTSGSPWHVEAVSTTTWEIEASFETDWPVLRLQVSPDGGTVAAANSGREEILLLNGSTLAPVRTVSMPMRVGTMCFTMDSSRLIVLDAAALDPWMAAVDVASGEIIDSGRPLNSYLYSFRMPGTNTLLLPRGGDERVSVLNMENLIFAPSLQLSNRPGAVCSSDDGEYIAVITATSTPGRAVVFHHED